MLLARAALAAILALLLAFGSAEGVRSNREPVDHPALDALARAAIESPLSKFLESEWYEPDPNAMQGKREPQRAMVAVPGVVGTLAGGQAGGGPLAVPAEDLFEMISGDLGSFVSEETSAADVRIDPFVLDALLLR